MYDMKRGEWSVQHWGRHLLRYYDGRFLNDQFFTLFVYNTIQRHLNNTSGNFFFKSDRFIGKDPPTIEKLKRKLRQGDIRYIQMLRYYARNIKGSDNYWRARTEDLEAWIQHHISRGRGPPTFFITFSCAEYWWPDLRRLLEQLERNAGNDDHANAIKEGQFTAIKQSAKRFPLYVNDFFMRKATKFLDTVVKVALGIEHYWGRVEFAPGRGQIHLHLVAIAKDKAYLQDFYKAKTMEDKAKVVNKYAIEKLDMTADVNIKDDDPNSYPPPTSPLAKRYCETKNEAEDVRLLAEDCMCHHCNRFCLPEKKGNKPRVCRARFGTEKTYGMRDTPGMPLISKPQIVTDEKGIKHFYMKRLESQRVVQHSRTLLRGWRANCDIKLLLYFSNPNLPDVGEIEDVCRYVVAYTGKKHHTSQEEQNSIKHLIHRYVQNCYCSRTLFSKFEKKSR